MRPTELVPQRYTWCMSILYFGLSQVGGLAPHVETDLAKLERIIEVGRTLGYEAPTIMEFAGIADSLGRDGQLVEGFDITQMVAELILADGGIQ